MESLGKCLKWMLTAALVTLLLFPIGCQKDSLLNPTDQDQLGSSLVQPILLKSKNKRFLKPFIKEQTITVKSGGTISVGNDISGYSTIVFKPNDVDQDTLITFGWDTQGYFTNLGPHGIVFNSPVEISLSYKDADLSNVKEDNLQLWYYHENKGGWELIGGSVDKSEKKVHSTISHFSRYAIAYSR